MVTAFGAFPGVQPFHSQFHQPFTSTITPGFNIWPVVLTALLFFTVLSWYNAFLALYEYYFQHDQDRDVLRNNLSTLVVFAVLWTVFAFLLYKFLNGNGLLIKDKYKNKDAGDDFRPSADANNLTSEALAPI